jgi:transposase
MLADALGRPLRFIVTAGQVNDITQAPALLDGQSGEAVFADKAYDSNALRATIAEIGATAVIPSNRTRRIIIPHDADAYKQRNRIERLLPAQALPTLGNPLRQTNRQTLPASSISPPQ